MAFVGKLTDLLSRPNQDPALDETPWYKKYGARILGIVGAVIAILLGLGNCVYIIVFSLTSLISGLLQIVAGFIVLMLEAPFCFICTDHVGKIADMADTRPLWNRAALYCIVALPPVIIAPGLSSLFGCGLIFATGVVYGMMGLGNKRRATTDEIRQDVRQAAVNSVISGVTTTNDRAGIINNAQPFSFTGAVGTDSNV